MAMKKRSFQLSQKQRLREMGSGQERQLTKEEMEAREAAGSAATRRCVCRPRLQRARVRLSLLRRTTICVGPTKVSLHVLCSTPPSSRCKPAHALPARSPAHPAMLRRSRYLRPSPSSTRFISGQRSIKQGHRAHALAARRRHRALSPCNTASHQRLPQLPLAYDTVRPLHRQHTGTHEHVANQQPRILSRDAVHAVDALDPLQPPRSVETPRSSSSRPAHIGPPRPLDELYDDTTCLHAARTCAGGRRHS